MEKLDNTSNQFVSDTGFFLCVGKAVQTHIFLGMQPLLRKLKLGGVENVDCFEWDLLIHGTRGSEYKKISGVSEVSGAFVFKSEDIFDASVPYTMDKVQFLYSVLKIRFICVRERVAFKEFNNLCHLNGLVLIFSKDKFVTGTHIIQGVTAATRWTWFRDLAKRIGGECKRTLLDIFFPNVLYKKDAIGAVTIRITDEGGSGLVVFQNDNFFSGLRSRFFTRDSAEQSIYRVPPARARQVSAVRVPLKKTSGCPVSRQLLMSSPPLGVSRVLSGEEFSNGSISLDHSYFQQPLGSLWSKSDEVRFFSRRLLDKNIIGPSNPWPLFHSLKVNSSIAISNQFQPEKSYTYDLLVFSERGDLVLRKDRFCSIPPWGYEVKSVSKTISDLGMEDFDGTYLICYSAENEANLLPGRIHLQGLYEFADNYWNGVQSDSSIWSSPPCEIREIENLSGVKTRRKQLWYVPIFSSKIFETLICLSNISYSLAYSAEQTLQLELYTGSQLLDSTRVTLNPFGSLCAPIENIFPGLRQTVGSRIAEFYGEVHIRPISGKTFCASYLIRDRLSQKFMMEHALPVPKYAHEK